MKHYLRNIPASLAIAGTGHAVGNECLTNSDLIERYNIRIKPSFIDKSVGIQTRYFLDEQQTTSDLATQASKAALAQAGITVAQLDRLILATSTPDHQTPSTACIVQHKLGGKGFPANDVVAACSGFLYGLDQALRCLATGDEYVLVIGADSRSRTLNMQDKRTAFLYGDGAGAVLLKRTEQPVKSGFLDCYVDADGVGHDAVYVPAGGATQPCTPENVAALEHKLLMPSGERVAQNALTGFVQCSQRLLERNQLTLNDIDQIIFHQPNRRLLETVMREMGLDEQKVFINFQHYGNTVAGSVPIALSEAFAAQRISPGDKVMLCAVGGGFTMGAALYQA